MGYYTDFLAFAGWGKGEANANSGLRLGIAVETSGSPACALFRLQQLLALLLPSHTLHASPIVLSAQLTSHVRGKRG